jgi:hypothetical protein
MGDPGLGWGLCQGALKSEVIFPSCGAKIIVKKFDFPHHEGVIFLPIPQVNIKSSAHFKFEHYHGPTIVMLKHDTHL